MTEEKKYIEKAIESIGLVLEKLPVSAWALDEEENILYMNEEMCALFGNLTGQNSSIIYPAEEPLSMESFVVFAEDEAEDSKDENSAFSEILIADVPFRRMDVKFVLENTSLKIELFEDISESYHLQRQLRDALAKVKAETRVAKGIQNSVLPIDDRYWNSIDFASVYLPADDLGGDVYDIMKINDDEFLMYIADVSGHGIQASLLTIFIREQVRANLHLAEEGTELLLGRIQREFLELDIDGMLYITVLLCKYSRKKRELSVANAGHNCFPIVARKDRRMESIPIKGMPICAIGEEDSFEEEIVGLSPGDRLILYTDGIVEEFDPVRKKVFGAEGVRDTAERFHEYNAASVARAILEESSKYMLVKAKDDRTIVVADIVG